MRASISARGPRARPLRGATVAVLAAMALVPSEGQGQTRLSKLGSVTLQVVALDPSRLADGVLLIEVGQPVELELRATNASGQPIDLSSTSIGWRPSDPNLLEVRGTGPSVIVARRSEGEGTLAVAALGQTVTLRAPAGNAPSPAAAVPSQPVTQTATLVPPNRAVRTNLPIRDLCASGTPHPTWGQPCIRHVSPASARNGATLWVKGTGFTNASVLIGGVGGAHLLGDTLLYMTVTPAMNDGSIVVTNPSSSLRSTASFNLDRSPPTLLPLDPDSGLACTRTTIRGTGLWPPVRIGAVEASRLSGGDTAIEFTIPRLPRGVTSGFVRVGPQASLVSSTPFKVLMPLPTASPDGFLPNIIWAGSTQLRFVGHLEDVTKVTFAGGVELTQGWTVSRLSSVAASGCVDRLEILVPAGAQSGPVTFTNPRGSVSVDLTISH